MDEQRPENEPESLLRLLREAVGSILRTEDAEAFLCWMVEEAPRHTPELFSGLPSPRARRAFALALGRDLWNATPLPRNGFQPLPLAPPDPRRPCPCGSGFDYALCCAAIPPLPGLTPELVWGLVLEDLSAAEAAELARQGKVPPQHLVAVASRLLDLGEAERAREIVEPLLLR